MVVASSDGDEMSFADQKETYVAGKAELKKSLAAPEWEVANTEWHIQ